MARPTAGKVVGVHLGDDRPGLDIKHVPGGRVMIRVIYDAWELDIYASADGAAAAALAKAITAGSMVVPFWGGEKRYPMPDSEERPLFSVLKRPDGTCAVLQLEKGVDAGGSEISFWVEVATVSGGYAFAHQIVDRMNHPPAPARARARPARPPKPVTERLTSQPATSTT